MILILCESVLDVQAISGRFITRKLIDRFGYFDLFFRVVLFATVRTLRRVYLTPREVPIRKKSVYIYCLDVYSKPMQRCSPILKRTACAGKRYVSKRSLSRDGYYKCELQQVLCIP